jgi:hypothetical protein
MKHKKIKLIGVAVLLLTGSQLLFSFSGKQKETVTTALPGNYKKLTHVAEGTTESSWTQVENAVLLYVSMRLAAATWPAVYDCKNSGYTALSGKNRSLRIMNRL